MKLSAEFRTELFKALRLSFFLTAIVFGVLVFSAGQIKDSRTSRAVASDPEGLGIREHTSRRAVPPFVRSAQ